MPSGQGPHSDAAPRYPLLTSPATIGTLELRNRLALPSMLMNYASDSGEATERLVRYFQRIAAGGMGLLMTECTFVRYKGGIATRGLALHDDRFIPGLSRLASAVHDEGGRLGVQLFFDGAGRTFASEETVSIGPSDLAAVNGMSMEPMSVELIEAMTADFVAAARRAARAGVDVVELHMAHAHLLGRFLSPFFNRRGDGYGGSTAARLKFPLAVLAGVRGELGDDFPVTARLSLSEGVDGGIELDEAVAIGRALGEAGIDAVHLSVGSGTTPLGLSSVFPTSFRPEAPFAALAREWRRRTGLTTLFAGRIVSHETGERMLAEGVADIVSVGRAALADPDWPAKASSGGRLVPCIGCNQGCADRLGRQKEITCTVNPLVGFEAEAAAVSRLPRPARAVVIGAGIGGLACALNLARRGARVTVYERQARIGGQFRHCAQVPGKRSYGDYLAYLAQELGAAAVEIRTDADPDAGPAAAADADLSFWAGGALPDGDWDRGGLGVPVVDGCECFESPLFADGDALRVIVVGAGQVGCDAALWLAARGHRVTLAERRQDPLAALEMRRHDYERALDRAGVELAFGAEASGGEGSAVALRSGGGGALVEVSIDAVVTATGRHATPRPALPAGTIGLGDAERLGDAVDAVRQATFHGLFADLPD